MSTAPMKNYKVYILHAKQDGNVRCVWNYDANNEDLAMGQKSAVTLGFPNLLSRRRASINVEMLPLN